MFFVEVMLGMDNKFINTFIDENHINAYCVFER